MKTKFTFLFFLLFFAIIFSQTTVVQWQASKIVDYGNQKIAFPFFSNDGYDTDGKNIYLHITVKAPEENIQIGNLRWEKITEEKLYGLAAAGLPERDLEDVIYRINENGERTASVSVATLKRVKSEIFRLSSFEVIKNTVSTAKKSGNFFSKNIGTAENPLKQGTFYKIKVPKSGIFKITTQFLKDNGINPAGINPKNFRIYGNGGIMLPEYNGDIRFGALQEDAIQVVGEEDGVWDEGDYAIFYAQGPDGYNLYNRGIGKGYKRTDTRLDDLPTHSKNIYEDYSYYFINFDNGTGKRVQTEDSGIPQNLITRYDEYQVLDEDKQNLMSIGRIWVGDAFNSPKTVTFTTNSQINPSDSIIYRTQIVGLRSQGNSVKIDINGLNPYDQTISASDVDFRPLRTYGTITGQSGSQITFNYSPNISVNPVGNFFLDYAEVQYKEDLKFNGKQMNFRYYGITEGSGNLYGFSLANAESVEQIWDVSDVTTAKKKVNKAGNNATFNFGYSAKSPTFNNEFVAFNAASAYVPTFIGKIENQDLASLQNVDYLIVTSSDMMPQAERLATFHRTKDNFNVQVVDVKKIYNEYSSGGQDVTAIRDFVTHLNTTNGKLKYLFILGDTSYDYKNRIPNNTNIVPSYESEESGCLVSSFVTDDYFVMTVPQTAARITMNLPNLPVGRLTAANTSEAKAMIDKTLAYYNALPNQSTPFGEWRMKADFVTDDDLDGIGGNGGTPFHVTTEKNLVANFETGTTRSEYNIRKVYMDAFPAVVTAGGQRFPQVNQIINNDISGTLFLMYFGHGGINGWAQERILTSSDAQNFNNFNNIYSRFPLIGTITCEFTLWDDPATNSVGEQVSKKSTGGAATMITSSRAIDIYYGVYFSGLLVSNIFQLVNDDFIPLGDAHLAAKTQMGSNSNHLKVNFLGDPAMKLARPKRLITIDNIDSPIKGQLRALDFVKIRGHINKADGALDSNFSGRVSLNIFDKKQDKATLNNDGNLGVMQYKEEGSAIVKTSAMAAGGIFEAQFYVPKDINYTVGTGRILAYADNKSYDVFSTQPQTVGDINPNGINDSQAPKVNLFMNNTSFADGGITNQNPTFLACITDDSGINSTGSGVGHDITVILDGQVINTIILNDFYASGEGNGCTNAALADYQKGLVTYPFRNLSPGQHQLTFKVWDINNNSTTATLNFVVKDESSQNLTVNRLLNWPNPFTDKTYIQFEHNCDDILNVNVQIYTITGKLVRTLSNTVTSDPFLQGYRVPRQAIEWDGRDDFGDLVGKGTYIYKIFAQAANQEKCKGSAAAVEKMVILK